MELLEKTVYKVDNTMRRAQAAEGKVIIRSKPIDLATLSMAKLRALRRRFVELDADFGDTTEWYVIYYAMVAEEMHRRNDHKVAAEAAYEIAKAIPHGETAQCAMCGKDFVKRHVDQAFCSNARTSGKDNCKDRFWNNKRS